VERGLKPPNRVADPVCGMKFDPRLSDFMVRHEGSTYYFCCPVCRRRFEEHPERYVQRDEP
jgi:YHS domain-containing protein